VYLDAYSWESLISISISVSNLFTIIRWPTLATVVPTRTTTTTTMSTRLHHQHLSKF
jgi:hypothetical protein